MSMRSAFRKVRGVQMHEAARTKGQEFLGVDGVDAEMCKIVSTLRGDLTDSTLQKVERLILSLARKWREDEIIVRAAFEVVAQNKSKKFYRWYISKR